MVTTMPKSRRMEKVQIGLPAEMLMALRRIAADEDASVGQVIRDAVTRDLFRRDRAKKPVRADERLVAPLRALLADDFAYARNWPDLQARLTKKGFTLRPAGGGLALYRLDRRRLCKSSELGYSYSRLMSRLKRPFPGSAPVRNLVAGRTIALAEPRTSKGGAVG